MNPQQPFNPNQPPNSFPPQPPYNQQPPYGAPQSPYGGGPGGYLPSANGGLILGLGIASIFCAGIILGPIAWVMGNNALAAIDSGQANPAERGNVSAGRICGMVGTGLWIIAIIINIIVFVGVMGAAATHPSSTPTP